MKRVFALACLRKCNHSKATYNSTFCSALFLTLFLEDALGNEEVDFELFNQHISTSHFRQHLLDALKVTFVLA